MDLFTIDTVGSSNLAAKVPNKLSLPLYDVAAANFVENPSPSKVPNSRRGIPEQSEESDDEDYGGLPPPSKDISKILHKDCSPSTSSDKRLNQRTIFDDFSSTNVKNKQTLSNVKKLAETDVNEHMKTSVITEAVEKQENLAKLSMSDRQVKELNRVERAKTKGDKWFNLPAQEMTEEIKNELEVIRMRSVLDPKHFYKRSEMKTLPKYFQIGKVIESPLDYYNERGTKKSKAKSLVDELLEDAQFQKFNKKKYAEALEKRKKKAYHKAAMKMKKLKKKKK
ncbi:deoxynucleotidyltransferase terminal-interacting protein 2 [Sabethes cyaneus]|uniref:deoxynucleotidyltransferase terminal-interacting protein 2 n=1 Tax=Sabethes cyaneus TaxID=53552 RepID=UPI00237DB10C|nr:deoxynucleotidyltransferase terminal-interacting protein 2 [Sabethes cyaneus]XP_053693845.1 deoxynucleotidyltransferase terminal-interacting protein 2 [Sabethes cyaneus]XP_053693846.1 deoxynucleotidyltransferase terminal-interacting protein 2 [Sabethes cyaneus]